MTDHQKRIDSRMRELAGILGIALDAETLDRLKEAMDATQIKKGIRGQKQQQHAERESRHDRRCCA